MILESLFSELISNVLKDLLTRVITDRRKRLDEKEIEQIVAAYLAQHQSPLSPPLVAKEIYIILGNSGFVDGHGQFALPLLENKRTLASLAKLLERNYVEGVKKRLGASTSSELEAAPSELGTTGLVQRFEGGKDDPVGASVYWSQRYGAYPVWGWIARCYEGYGGTGSRLGFPTSPELPAAASPQGTTGQVQRFEGNGDGANIWDEPNRSLIGVSIYCSGHGAYATWGRIGRCYERLGGTTSRLGFPLSPEQETQRSSRGHPVWKQRFEGGEISCEWGSAPVVHT